MIADRVLQYSLEEHWELLARARCVFLGKFEHRVLHGVERDLLVARRKKRLLVCATLYRGQKIGEFLAGSQWSRLILSLASEASRCCRPGAAQARCS
jgi:hypothetical protein